jgi:5'(3')-deoxyribonucleotidase
MDKILLLDVDGVVANFGQYYLDIVESKLGYKYNISDLVEWNYWDVMKLSEYERQIIDHELHLPGCASRLEPHEGAVAGVLGLIEVCDVRFVTAPLRGNSTWVYDRNLWLREYFGFEVADRTIYAQDKSLIYGDIFVDDKISNLSDWRFGVPIIWDHLYNRGCEFRRMSDWSELREFVIGL